MNERREWGVGDLVDLLDEWFPPGLAESWDNVGLLLGDRAGAVRKVMTCLTVTAATAKEAIAQKADLIVTHHPILFRPIKRLIAEGPSSFIYSLARAGIAVYSPHTSFDGAVMGINEQIAGRLGLVDIKALRPIETQDISISPAGSGRLGQLPAPVELGIFAETLRRALNAAAVSFVGASKRRCQRVAIGCGAGMEFLPDAVRNGCDVLVTGEARFHQYLEAEELGIGLILAGHYSTERFALETLADRLGSACPPLEVWASRLERDPLTTLLHFSE